MDAKPSAGQAPLCMDAECCQARPRSDEILQAMQNNPKLAVEAQVMHAHTQGRPTPYHCQWLPFRLQSTSQQPCRAAQTPCLMLAHTKLDQA